MRCSFRFLLFAAWSFVLALPALPAQNPVKWAFSSKNVGDGQYDLILTGTIDDGWSTYSQFLESEDGPLPTELVFQEGAHYKLVGKAKESGDISKAYDKVFDMTISKFKHKAIFTQRIQVTDAAQPVIGYISYITCNDESCMPPKSVDFIEALRK